MSRIEIQYRIENGCWVCFSHRPNQDGYPRVRRDGKIDMIYRYMFSKYNGEVPNGHIIRHTCDNRLCINPKHLITGTRADNVKDRMERGRSATGANNGRSKLSEKEVLTILKDEDTPKMHLAKKYGVDPKVIRDIKNGVIWKCVTGL